MDDYISSFGKDSNLYSPMDACHVPELRSHSHAPFANTIDMYSMGVGSRSHEFVKGDRMMTLPDICHDPAYSHNKVSTSAMADYFAYIRAATKGSTKFLTIPTWFPTDNHIYIPPPVPHGTTPAAACLLDYERVKSHIHALEQARLHRIGASQIASPPEVPLA
jgi:hypothetical protein